MNIRGDLQLRAPTTATVRHGERLEILETRRRFVKVRTASGAVGWTDSAYLLTQAQMDDLNRLAEQAAQLPSMGAATVLDALNVHTAASRSAPSFAQLKQGDPIEVIGHRVTPRPAGGWQRPKAGPVAVASSNTPASTGQQQGEPKPPPASPPSPPQSWTTLSRPRRDEIKGAPRRVSTDDWFLVRTPGGRAGWVLTRMVLMNIPDEVAQYAEGHFIMSYHSLGEVRDEARGVQKSNWLWTTSPLRDSGVDFDSFRVFVYNPRRHRYETAYIERNVRGHYPVQAFRASGSAEAGFSLIIEEKGGQWFQRTYAFDGTRARLTAKRPYQPPPPLPEVRDARAFDATPAPAESGWSRRLRDFGRRWFSW